MRHLLIYLKDYKKECILAPLFKMLEASFELFIPIVVASMVDRGIADGDKGYIIKCCILLGVLALVGLISAVTAQFFSAKAAVSFATGVRKDLFAHLLDLSFIEYDNLGSSTMITRMTNDVMQAQTGVNMFLRLTLRSPFVVFGAMIMAFTIDFKAALVFVCVIVILFAVVGLIMVKNIPLIIKAQEKLDKVLLYTRENLAGIRVLRSLSREVYEKENYSNANDELFASQLKAARVSSVMNPATYIIINMAIVCLIYVGAIRVDAGVMTQGSVIALYNYMSQILVELIKLANMVVTLNKALASGDRIAKVLKIEDSQKRNTSITGYEASDDYIVEFNSVSFKYNEGGDDALEDISFNVKRGETIGIVGGTGSGKTTLVNLIPRFYDALGGSVKVFGKNVFEYDPVELRSRVGFVFQKAALFSGTIADNLRYGKTDATNDEMLKAMHLAVADDIITAKGGIDADIGEAGKELSGGQKQRISIARALIKKSEILILDDSTSALDFATTAQFINNIKNLDYKPTIFIVSQRTNTVISADKIIVLEDGKMIGLGTHDELMRNCDVYKEIHNSQYGTKKEVNSNE